MTVAAAPHLRRLGFVVVAASLVAIGLATLWPEPSVDVESHFCLICGSFGTVDAFLNVLLFVPWGFLLFIALYTVNRPTMQTYVLTVLLGFTFTCAIEGWQYFLPDRVADINDIIWNTTGALLGAILGHLRERLRFEFA